MIEGSNKPSEPVPAIREVLDQIGEIEKLPKLLQPIATAWLYISNVIKDIFQPLK